MRKLFAMVFTVLFLSAVSAAARERAISRGCTPSNDCVRPAVIEITAPASVGISYGPNQQYILLAKDDGTFWWQPYAPNSLGNSMPTQVLDVSAVPAKLVIRTSSGVTGIRFFPKNDVVNPGAILPFDPLNPSMPDMFISGIEVDNVLMDCPVAGIPNDGTVMNIVAYNHDRRYIILDPTAHLIDAFTASSIGVIDGPDGFRMILFDHYQDQNGQWFVPEAQCARDANGNLFTSARTCYSIQ